jgi:hypothetical protein
MFLNTARCLAGIIFAPLLPIALALVDVNWSTERQESINIVAPDREQDILSCLENSLKARLRFEVRLCRKRSGWFDHCAEPRSELHTATYDEVTESYRVVADRLNDAGEPIAVEVPTRAEAVKLVTAIEALPIAFLTRDEPEIVRHSGAYLQVRTVFMCRGNSSRPFAHISRILTLGLLNNVEDRSDWSDFTLHQRDSAAAR